METESLLKHVSPRNLEWNYKVHLSGKIFCSNNSFILFSQRMNKVYKLNRKRKISKKNNKRTSLLLDLSVLYWFGIFLKNVLLFTAEIFSSSIWPHQNQNFKSRLLLSTEYQLKELLMPHNLRGKFSQVSVTAVSSVPKKVNLKTTQESFFPQY